MSEQRGRGLVTLHETGASMPTDANLLPDCFFLQKLSVRLIRNKCNPVIHSAQGGKKRKRKNCNPYICTADVTSYSEFN